MLDTKRNIFSLTKPLTHGVNNSSGLGYDLRWKREWHRSCHALSAMVMSWWRPRDRIHHLLRGRVHHSWATRLIDWCSRSAQGRRIKLAATTHVSGCGDLSCRQPTPTPRTLDYSIYLSSSTGWATISHALCYLLHLHLVHRFIFVRRASLHFFENIFHITLQT